MCIKLCSFQIAFAITIIPEKAWKVGQTYREFGSLKELAQRCRARWCRKRVKLKYTYWKEHSDGQTEFWRYTSDSLSFPFLHKGSSLLKQLQGPPQTALPHAMWEGYEGEGSPGGRNLTLSLHLETANTAKGGPSHPGTQPEVAEGRRRKCGQVGVFIPNCKATINWSKDELLFKSQSVNN